MAPIRLFVSYHFSKDGDKNFSKELDESERFLSRVTHNLNQQPGLETFLWANEKRLQNWHDRIFCDALEKSDRFALVLGSELGDTQTKEARAWIRRHRRSITDCSLIIELPGAIGGLPAPLKAFEKVARISVHSLAREGLLHCARETSIHLLQRWLPDDGIPIGYPFDYEKDVIAFYRQPDPAEVREKAELGCPQVWPTVSLRTHGALTYPNPWQPKDISTYRQSDAEILVDARYRSGAEGTALTLLEAGPRSNLSLPRHGAGSLRVAVIVSGGIAPGINSVLEGLVERHCLYANGYRNPGRGRRRYRLEIDGMKDGFAGVLASLGSIRLNDSDRNGGDQPIDALRRSADLGGSLIGTSRAEDMLAGADAEIRARQIRSLLQALQGYDIVYIIGGDGSMKAAHALSTIASDMHREGHLNEPPSIVGIPKTMDNDILWVWQSFGFLSAVERAKQFAVELHTEAESNPRLVVMQLFGSDSGFVVSHTALASDVCDLALVPECKFSMRAVCDHIEERLRSRFANHRRAHGLVIVAETAIPTDVDRFLDGRDDVRLNDEEIEAIKAYVHAKRRVHGQPSDALRSGGLKIVAGGLQRHIRDRMGSGKDGSYWHSLRVLTSEPRHLIRASAPNPIDRIAGHRLGMLAVDNAMAGYNDFMISQWLTEYVLVPLPLVVLGRKRLHTDGIFWKSVVAATGQPENLTTKPGRRPTQPADSRTDRDGRNRPRPPSPSRPS